MADPKKEPADLSTSPGLTSRSNEVTHISVVHGFLSTEDCVNMVRLIDRNCRPSTIADVSYGSDPLFRTSETCDLDERDPHVARINQRLCAFVGVDPVYGEPLQGQRYMVGQEFKAHTDRFEEGGSDYPAFCGRSGNRTYTLMVYLNEPLGGGVTRFPLLNRTFYPETGLLLCWDNRLADGSTDPGTIHHGTVVTAGTKYVITKWIRERPWC